MYTLIKKIAVSFIAVSLTFGAQANTLKMPTMPTRFLWIRTNNYPAALCSYHTWFLTPWCDGLRTCNLKRGWLNLGNAWAN